MNHHTLLAVLLVALAPSVASAQRTSVQDVDVSSETHVRVGLAPISVGPPAFENDPGPAHTLLVAGFGARFRVTRWLALTGSFGGAVIVQPGGEETFNGAAMPVPVTLGAVAATSLRDGLRLGGELRYARAVDTSDRIRAADVAASVYLHDAELAWSQADRVSARSSLTWTRGDVRLTGAAGVTQYRGGALARNQSVVALGVGVARAVQPRTTLTADVIVYTDAHDEGYDEGYDVAGAIVAGFRRAVSETTELGVTASYALVERMEREGQAGFGLAAELRWPF